MFKKRKWEKKNGLPYHAGFCKNLMLKPSKMRKHEDPSCPSRHFGADDFFGEVVGDPLCICLIFFSMKATLGNPPTPLWRWRRAYWGANSYTKCSITFVNIAVAISALAGGGAKTPLRVGWPPTPQVYFGPWEGLRVVWNMRSRAAQVPGENFHFSPRGGFPR